MKKTYKFEYTELEIPPRCRKERYVTHEDGVVTINIKETTKEEAPVAFRVKEYDREEVEVRLYKNKLYKQVQDRREDWREITDFRNSETQPLWVNQKVNENLLDWYIGNRFHRYGTKDENISKSRERASQLLIIDGDMYERCGEPYYYLQTFGLGGNGSVGMFVGYNSYCDRKKKHKYGMSPLNKQYAVDRYYDLAKSWNDQSTMQSIKENGETYYNIKVEIPSAVKKIYSKK